ncbi:MAG: AMP-binding protein [Gemmatimonadota bacterium]|nr:AMP-binding protein [Gemmatimonadota bacterium]
MLGAAAARAADRAAVIERHGTVSYARLRDTAAAIAVGLQARGVEPGDRVALLLHRGATAAAACFGVAARGGVTVILNETLRLRQIEYVLSHCDARVLVSSRELLGGLPRAPETRARIVDVSELSDAATFEPAPRIGSDVAQIIYTSGSTGLPKGVTITHANLWAGARAVSGYLQITAADRIASLLPFSFDYGFNQLLCAVLNGASLVVERSPLPQQIALTLRERGVTVLPCVPPLWLQLLGAPEFHGAVMPALRAMTNTGGRLPVEAVRRLRQMQPRAQLVLMYGLTEAFRATYLPPDEVDAHPDSIGRAIPGAEIMVVREDGTECAPGEEGELVQRGPTVAAGYWNDPEATARVFRPNPRRPPGAPDTERVVFSGDIVRRDEGGRLYFVGRRDRIIKTLGFRVSPDEVCEVLYASGEVAEALVGAEPDDQRGERIIAYVVLTGDGDAGRLQRFCRAELPRYMQPARIDVMPSLPRTSTGKFDLRAVEGGARV